jgi:transcription antitermination factor NusA-like protein
MKICSVCRQSDMLCNACSKKVEEGQIKKVDVELSKALTKIGKEKGFDLDYVEIIDNGRMLFVVVESEMAGKFIGPGGKTINRISEMVGKRVKLLEKTEGSDKIVIEKLIGAPVVGVNKIFSVSGEAMKVRVQKKYARNVQPLASIVGKILDKKISFVFE